MTQTQHYYGYIEGYYGRELTWDQRFSIVDHLHDLSMNTFLYAPKEDPYHRVQWKTPYPKEWQVQLSTFVAHGRKKKVTIIPALAPGLSFNYTSKKDYSILRNKFQRYFSMGMHTVALLMDDISEELPQSCKQTFSSLGEAHGLLLQKLQTDLEKENKNCILLFCPTIYTDQFVSGSAADCLYIQDLSRTIPSTIGVFWTGPHIVSETLTQKNLAGITKVFNNNLIIWDNYYANDYAPLRLFVGPYAGRDHSITTLTRGILLNPTGLFHTDTFLLSLFSDFLKTKKATTLRWEKVAEQFSISPVFRRIRKHFWSPFSKPSEKDFSKAALKRYGSLFDELLVPWTHPMKLEWFSYIHSFNLDCTYLKLNPEKRDSWVYKRYPPVIANRMVRS